jgi:phosphatidylserine decarboxylase
MVRDAYLFLIPLAASAAFVFLLGLWPFAVLLLLLGLFVIYFFRDPDRIIPQDPSAIVSPADGKIVQVRETEDGKRISIFLSIFDVHVNRAPIAGEIIRREYRPGRFKLAFSDDASVENEQIVLTIAGARPLTFSLIAGLVARRIVAWKEVGDIVEKGDRLGLIRFGSRADVFCPSDCEVLVSAGDRVRGGSSVIARWIDLE